MGYIWWRGSQPNLLLFLYILLSHLFCRCHIFTFDVFLSYNVIGSGSWLVAKVGFWIEANSSLFWICVTEWPCGATDSRVQQAVSSDGEHNGTNRRRGSCQSQRPWISFLFFCRESHSTCTALKGIKDEISKILPYTPVWRGCWD